MVAAMVTTVMMTAVMTPMVTVVRWTAHHGATWASSPSEHSEWTRASESTAPAVVRVASHETTE